MPNSGRPRPSLGNAAKSNQERTLAAQLQLVQTEKQQIATERDELERDKESFRKRVMGQAERKLAWAVEPLIRELLDSLDNIERAINSTADDNTRDGLLAIYRQILGTLSRHGVDGIVAHGEHFNANFHEVIGMVEDPSKPNKTVVAIARNGYTLHGRVIRAAQVQVNQLSSGTGPLPQPAHVPPPTSVPPAG